jgi:hypothetical protein
MHGAPFIAVLLLVFFISFPELTVPGIAVLFAMLAYLFFQAYAFRLGRRTNLTKTQQTLVYASLPATIAVAVVAFWFAPIDAFGALVSAPMLVFYPALAWSTGMIGGIVESLTPKLKSDDFEYPLFLQDFKETER